MKKYMFFFVYLLLALFSGCGLENNKLEEMNNIDNERILNLRKFDLLLNSYLIEKKTFPKNQYQLFDFIKKKKVFDILKDSNNLTYIAVISKGKNAFVLSYILGMKMKNPKNCDVNIYSDNEMLQAITNNEALKEIFLSAPASKDGVHKLEKKLKEIYGDKTKFKSGCLKILARTKFVNLESSSVSIITY